MQRDVLQLVEAIEAALHRLRRTGGDVATLTVELEQILQEIRGALDAR